MLSYRPHLRNERNKNTKLKTSLCKVRLHLSEKHYAKPEVGTNNIVPKAQHNKAQRSFQLFNAQRKMRVVFFNFRSGAQLPQ